MAQKLGKVIRATEQGGSAAPPGDAHQFAAMPPFLTSRSERTIHLA
jgi:hypothetical protein